MLRIAYIKDKLVVVPEKPRRLYLGDNPYYGSDGRGGFKREKGSKQLRAAGTSRMVGLVQYALAQGNPERGLLYRHTEKYADLSGPPTYMPASRKDRP